VLATATFGILLYISRNVNQECRTSRRGLLLFQAKALASST
jgi:hypothetical protein